MTITYTEKAASGSAAGGTTATTAAFTATGGGLLIAEFQCASDSSVVSADPTGVSGHGGSWSLLTGKSFQSANPSGNSSLWVNSTYTTGSAAVVATWAASHGVHAWYVFEVVGGSTLTVDGSASFQGTAVDIRGLIPGSGQFAFQHIAFHTGTITAIPACHMTEQEDSNVSGLVSQNAAIYNGGGPIQYPTVGGLGSAVVGQWFLLGCVIYEGTAPTVATRTRAVSVRSASAASPITIPNTSITSGGLDLIWRCVKPSTATASNMADGANTDFTASTDVTGGTGASAVDAGATRSRFDYRIFGGGDTAATVSASFLNTPNSSVGIRVWNEDLTGNGHELAMGSGDDATHGTARSAVSGSLALEPGDHVYVFCGSDTDTTTAFTAAALTATSITFGPTVEHMGAGVAAGNDVGCMLYEAVVASGTATGAITLTLTGGPSNCGQTLFLVVHADAGGASGTGSPAAIATTVTVPAATAQAGTTVSPAAVTSAVTVPQASVGVSATATPGVIAASVSVPAAAAQAGSVVSPAVVARTVTVPSVTPQAGTTVSPAVIARSVTVPAPTVTGAGSAAPAAVVSLATLPAPTLQAGAVPAPAAIGTVVTLPAVSAGGATSGTATPAALVTSATLPAPTTQAGSSASPAVIARTVTLPTATPQAGAVVSPALITRSILLPVVTATGGSTGTANPAAVAAVITLPAVTAQAGAVLTPAIIARSVTIPAATGSGASAGTATPAVIARTLALPTPTLQAGSSAAPAAIAALVSVPAVTPQVSKTVTPAVIVTSITVPAVTRQGGSTASPAVLLVTVTMPVASPRAGTVVTPATIALAVAIGLATIPGLTGLAFSATAGTPVLRIHAGTVLLRLEAGPPRARLTAGAPSTRVDSETPLARVLAGSTHA